MINDDSVQSHPYAGEFPPRSPNGANSVNSAAGDQSLVPASEMDVAFTIIRVKLGMETLNWANEGDCRTDDLSKIVKELDETVNGLDDTLAEIQARADKPTTPSQDAQTNADCLSLAKKAADAETLVQETLVELDRQCPDPSGQSVQQRYQNHRAEEEGHVPAWHDDATDQDEQSETVNFDGGKIEIKMSQAGDDVSQDGAEE